MPDTYNQMILQYMNNGSSTSHFNFKEPFVKPTLKYVYPLFILLHAIICLVAIVGNISMIVIIVRRRFYHDQTFVLFINLALADLIKSVLVMPMTLANLIIQNFLLGSFLCFFIPMLQWFPVHASMLTFLTIAIDRYRLIVQPFKSRVQASLCIIAVWVGSVCVVLPFAIYMRYYDLGDTLGKPFEGVGLCSIHLESRIEEYIRAMFVTLYAMPLATIALLYVRISAELKSKENVATRPLSAHFSPISTSTEVDLDRASMLNHHSGVSSGSGARSMSWSPVHEPPSTPTRAQRQHLMLQLNVSACNNRGDSHSTSQSHHANSSSGCGVTHLGTHHNSHSQGNSNSNLSSNFLSAPSTCPSSSVSTPRADSFSRSSGHRSNMHRGSASTTTSSLAVNGGRRNTSPMHSGAAGISNERGDGGGGERDRDRERTRSRSGSGNGSLPRRKHHSYTTTVTTVSDRSAQDSDDELDLPTERRTQNYLITMTTLFAMCWFPSHILTLVHNFVPEDEDNNDHYDVTYILFTWFGFLSTCTNPVLFVSWLMSDATRDRLRGYFRFSNRRRTSAGSQRRRYQGRYSTPELCTNLEERMIVDCKVTGLYGGEAV